MRYALELPAQRRLEWARRADAAGFAAVVVRAPAGAECASAAAVASVTDDVRVIVALALGRDHPVTLVEEINVADNISGGRLVVLLTAEGVEADRAREEVQLIRLAGSQSPVTFDGTWWTVPARLPEHDGVPATLMVTPPPAQLVVPLWAAPSVPASRGVIQLDAEEPDDVAQVRPVTLTLSGDLDRDLAASAERRSSGATHCLVRLPDQDQERSFDQLVRWIAPEAAMVDFPRVVADVALPAAWPGAAGVTEPRG